MPRPGGTPANLIPHKKGEPAKPGSGRPKGSRPIAVVLRELLAAAPEAKGDADLPTALRLVKFALGNDIKEETALRAIDMIHDRLYGKAPQQIQVAPALPSEEREELERVKRQYDALYTEDGKLMLLDKK